MGAEVIRNKYPIIRVTGEYDYYNIGEMRKAVEEALSGPPRAVIFDLLKAVHLDSSGIAMIIVAYKRVQPGGKVAIAVGKSVVRRMLELIRITEMPGFYLVDSIEAAEEILNQE